LAHRLSALGLGCHAKNLATWKNKQLIQLDGVSYGVEARDVQLGIRSVRVVLTSAMMLAGLVLAGCDDNVEVIRDPDVRVTKGMTWAWRPFSAPTPPHKDEDGRPVKSRDVIGAPPPRLESNRDWNNEENRTKLQDAIEHGLAAKGLTKISDPAVADFLVDYHVAVKTQRAELQRVYPGGYPGVICGPFGCWYGYGWGPPEVEYRTVQYHEGTFVLDITLGNPKKLAYRAISHKELNRRTLTTYKAEEAVQHLLKGLKGQ
jgi:hypothetical protein